MLQKYSSERPTLHGSVRKTICKFSETGHISHNTKKSTPTYFLVRASDSDGRDPVRVASKFRSSFSLRPLLYSTLCLEQKLLGAKVKCHLGTKPIQTEETTAQTCLNSDVCYIKLYSCPDRPMHIHCVSFGHFFQGLRMGP